MFCTWSTLIAQLKTEYSVITKCSSVTCRVQRLVLLQPIFFIHLEATCSCRSSGYAPPQRPGPSRLLAGSPALHVSFFLLGNLLHGFEALLRMRELFMNAMRIESCFYEIHVKFCQSGEFWKLTRHHFFYWTETGFDVDDTSVDGRDDIEGLDASAAHIANLLSSEPSDGTSYY